MSKKIVDADIVKGVDTQIMQEQASAPATPASGDFKLYVKSDGNLYGKNDGGTEFNLSSQSGSGGKNYLTEYTASLGAGAVNPGNGDFEKNSVAGWSLFNTTITSLVPTGSINSGASSITTFGPSGTNVLQKKYSLYIDSVAAITAGHGFISDAFYIDRQDQAKIMQIGFTYKVLTGSANINQSKTSANTFHVYMYDVTGSAWIQPVGVYNMDGSGKFVGSFQTTAAGTQYRIAVIACNASGGAASIQFDDFSCGPMQAQANGSAISAKLVGSSSTISNSDHSLITFTTVEIDSSGQVSSNNTVTIKESGTYSVYGDFQVSLTGGGSSGQNIAAHIYRNGGSVFSGTVPSISSGTFTYNPQVTTSLKLNAGDTIQLKGDQQAVAGSFAVSSASLIVTKIADASQSYAGVVVAARMTSSATTSFTNATSTKSIWNAVTFDKTGNVADTTNSRMNIPVAGDYQIDVSMFFNISAALANGAIQAYVYVNGAGVQTLGASPIVNGSNEHRAFSVSGKIPNLKSGDYVEVYLYQDSGNPISSLGAINQFAISKINTDSTVPVPQTVAALGANSSGQTFTSTGVTVQITATTQPINTQNALAASGTFTAPMAGLYSVAADISPTTSASSNATIFDLYITKNGSNIAWKRLSPTAAGNFSNSVIFGIGVSTIVRLNAGDTLAMSLNPTFSGGVGQPIYLWADAASNTIKIHRIGD